MPSGNNSGPNSISSGYECGGVRKESHRNEAHSPDIIRTSHSNPGGFACTKRKTKRKKSRIQLVGWLRKQLTMKWKPKGRENPSQSERRVGKNGGPLGTKRCTYGQVYSGRLVLG